MSSSSSRRTLLLGMGGSAASLLLGGCELKPLHAGSQGEKVDGELAAIAVTTPKDRVGYVLRDYLLDDLNPRGLNSLSSYDLVVRLQRTRNALIIQLNDDVTRYDLVLAAFFELRRKEDGKVLYRSAARRVASYNQRQAPFATQIAEQDAEERAARELAVYIRTQLALYFAGTTA